MDGKKSRSKGYRGEKQFRELAEEQGFYITWHNEDPNLPDVTVENLTGEIKYRKSVPKTLYKWLKQDEADFLALKRVEGRGSSREWLITLRLDDFWELIKGKKRKDYCVSCGTSIPTDDKHHKKYGNYCKECNMKSREIENSPEE